MKTITDIDQIKRIGSINEMANFISNNQSNIDAAERLIIDNKSPLISFYKDLQNEPSGRGSRKLFTEVGRLMSAEAFEAAKCLFLACLKRANLAFESLLKFNFSERPDLYLTKSREASIWISVANHCQLMIRLHYV